MQGGGIPEDSLEQVFRYGYTTVDDGELSSQVSLSHLRHVLHTLQPHLPLMCWASPTLPAMAADSDYKLHIQST